MYGQSVIPSDWTGEFCRYAVCWPNSPEWLAVLRGLLTTPARGRFWNEHTGTILEAQDVVRQTFDYNLQLNEVIMACNDTGLSEIAAAITLLATVNINNAGGCCDRRGSGGAGTIAPPFSDVFQGNPSVDPPPPDFDDWSDFTEYKCSIAWNIVETLQSDLGEMALLNLGNISISSLAALIAVAIATPIPFDDIIAIAGLLLAVAAEIMIASALSILNDNEEDLVCALFNGSSASGSRDNFLSLFNEFATSGIADPVSRFAVNSLMAYMLTSATVNRLYEEDLTRVWGVRDCTACQEAGWAFQTLPSGQLSGTLVSGSMESNSLNFVAQAVLELAGDPCQGTYLLVVLTPPGGKSTSSISLAGGSLSPSTCGVDWQWVRQSDGQVFNINNGTYAIDDGIAGQVFNYVAVRSVNPFSLEFDINP